jgi:general secretion pathway protein H
MATCKQESGFTLIEILVVVVIVATIASMTLLSIGIVGDDRDLDTERKRLASLLEVAQDEALMQGRELGVEFTTSAYRFVEFDPFTRQWSEIRGDDLFRQRSLPEGMEFELYIDDKRITLNQDLAEFDDPDDKDPVSKVQSYMPHLFVFASGEATAFEIRVHRFNPDAQLAMQGDVLGNIEFDVEEEL